MAVGAAVFGGAATTTTTTTKTPAVSFFYHRRFKEEKERLATFEHWPLAYIDPVELAMHGMFYCGVDDLVSCYYCRICIHKWKPGDNPLQEHRRLALGRSCSLLLRTESCRIQFADAARRLASFVDGWWPSDKPRPELMAAAGFYYIGRGDLVECFSCEKGFKDWMADDDPMHEHLKYSHGCSFIGAQHSRLRTTNITTTTTTTTTDDKVCKICYCNEYNVVFVPCGHVVACAECVLSLSDKTCPLCREKFSKAMQVFFS